MGSADGEGNAGGAQEVGSGGVELFCDGVERAEVEG